MKSFLLIILCCRVLLHAFPIFPQTEEVTEEEMKLTERYLNRDNPQPEPKCLSRIEGNNISLGKIRQQIKFCDANGTAKQHSDALAVMKKPKCGIPNIGAYSYFPGSPKWSTTDLTYSIENYTPDMNSTAVNEATEIAFSIWSKVTPLNFIKVSKNGNISITFYKEGHQAPFNEIVLAYAYSPGPGRGGDVLLNDGIYWTMDNKKTFKEEGVNYLIGVTHEVGHALGLGHSNVQGSVMKDEYVPSSYKYSTFQDCKTLQLHQDDIDGIQALYGPRNQASSAGAVPKAAV